jgi:hypothetical protein
LLVFNYFRKLKLLKVHHRKSLIYMLALPMGSIPVQLLELEVKGEKGRKEGEEEERSRRNQ